MNINIISMDGQISNFRFNCAVCRHLPNCRAVNFENECQFLGALRLKFKTVDIVSDFRTNMPRYIRIKTGWDDLRAGENLVSMMSRAENSVNAIRTAMTQNTK